MHFLTIAVPEAWLGSEEPQVPDILYEHPWRESKVGPAGGSNSSPIRSIPLGVPKYQAASISHERKAETEEMLTRPQQDVLGNRESAVDSNISSVDHPGIVSA